MSNNPLAEAYALAQGESEEVRQTFRRLLAAVVVGAISDLTSSSEQVRSEAADYLLTEGQRDVYALGFQCSLSEIIADPPDRKALRISRGRNEFTVFQGKRLKRESKAAA